MYKSITAHALADFQKACTLGNKIACDRISGFGLNNEPPAAFK
jgi:hypothetical protein